MGCRITGFLLFGSIGICGCDIFYLDGILFFLLLLLLGGNNTIKPRYQSLQSLWQRMSKQTNKEFQGKRSTHFGSQ